MAPPLRRRGGGSYRWIWRRFYGLLILSIGICIMPKLVFVSIIKPLVACSSCYCDCSYHNFLPISCQIDIEMIEELGKDRSTLIKEEIDLLKIVSDENMQRHKSWTEIAKKSSSQYKKEAESCNVGVSTCEEAREQAQEQLVEECKLTALWQKRSEMLAEP